MDAQTVAGPATDLVIQPRGIERLGGVLNPADNHSIPAPQLAPPEVFAGHDELPLGSLSGPPKIRISRGCDGEFVCQLVTPLRAYAPDRFASREKAIRRALPVARRLQAKIVGKGIKHRLAKGGA